MRTLARTAQAAGLLGLVAAIVIGILAVPGMARVDALLDRSETTLATAAAAARRSAEAFDGFNASLGEAVTAASDAASLASRSAQTARGLAGAMTISIFGAQPLLALAGGFEASAADLDGLAGTLSTMGTALDGNGDDLGAIQRELDRLADQLDELAEPRSLPPLVPVMAGLVVLLALQAGGLLAAGTALSRLGGRSAADGAGR